MARRLDLLPKAHLHLHFTGAMRRGTLIELAAAHGISLPDAFGTDWPPRLRGTDERGWFRFQRLYDCARAVLRTESDIRRLITEMAQDEVAEGSGWLEYQVDPSGYAGRFGGLTSFVELVLDATAAAARSTGLGIGVIIAANRTRHPLDARTTARLAASHAGRGVVGFGLSNDERRGAPADFAAAFRIASRAGLLAVPHGGELAGPASVRACIDELNADRIGHGVAAAAEPALVRRLAQRQTTLEVCPASNVALGVSATPAQVPLDRLLDAGVPVALGADDPLLFGSRLIAQYELARGVHGLADDQLASLARMSVHGSAIPAAQGKRLLAGIDAWLAAPDPAEGTAAIASAIPGARAAGRVAGSGYSVTPTSTGSLASSIPNTERTPATICLARAIRSAVVAPPRLVSASVCLAEILAAPPPG
jgi:adenosine deaminase